MLMNSSIPKPLTLKLEDTIPPAPPHTLKRERSMLFNQLKTETGSCMVKRKLAWAALLNNKRSLREIPTYGI